MSIHKSLKVRSRHVRQRNVLSREERIQLLEKGERWSEGDSIFGLPKVQVLAKARRRKGKEKAKEAEAAAEGAEAAAEAPEEGAARQ